MQFLDNKYTKWYFNIIYNTADIKIINETQHHHVLPRSIFPEYAKLVKHNWNGVHLTHREHFICHWLLTKMFADPQYTRSMLFAFRMLKLDRYNTRYQTKITSRAFSKVKEELAGQMSIIQKEIWKNRSNEERKEHSDKLRAMWANRTQEEKDINANKNSATQKQNWKNKSEEEKDVWANQTKHQWANKSQTEIDIIFAKRKVTWENKPQEEKDIIRKTLSEENKIKWDNKSQGEKEVHAQRSKDQATNRSSEEQHDLAEKHSKIWQGRSPKEKDAITNKRITTHNNKSSEEKDEIKQKRQQTRDDWDDVKQSKFSNKMKEIGLNRDLKINEKIASSIRKLKWYNNGTINTRCIPGTEPLDFTLGRIWKKINE